MTVRSLLLALFVSSPALAHAPSTGYLAIESDSAAAQLELKLDLRDVARLVNLDANRDGEVTWGELKRVRASLAAYVSAGFQLRQAGERCALAEQDLKIERLSTGVFAVLTFASPCVAPSRDLRYDLLFEVDADHRLIVNEGGSPAGVLSTGARELRLERGPIDVGQVFREFLWQGVVHIAKGFDHILFLLVLLLPVARASTFRQALGETLKVVTAFTVSHSLTLGLVTLGVFTLPSRLVESAIAFSIIVTAASNVRPFLGGRAWMVAGAFGLLHGCGFASVLGDLGVQGGGMLPSLIAFNLGVEVGQLTLVAFVLPLLFHFRRSQHYRTLVLSGGSAAAALLATVWMAERVFDFKVLPF